MENPYQRADIGATIRHISAITQPIPGDRENEKSVTEEQKSGGIYINQWSKLNKVKGLRRL